LRQCDHLLFTEVSHFRGVGIHRTGQECFVDLFVRLLEPGSADAQHQTGDSKKHYQAQQCRRCDEKASGGETLKTCRNVEVLEVAALLKYQSDVLVLARPHALDQRRETAGRCQYGVRQKTHELTVGQASGA